MFKVTEKATGNLGVAYKTEVDGKMHVYINGTEVENLLEKQFLKRFQPILDGNNGLPVEATTEEILAAKGGSSIPGFEAQGEQEQEPKPEEEGAQEEQTVEPGEVGAVDVPAAQDVPSDVPAAQDVPSDVPATGEQQVPQAPVPSPVPELVRYLGGSHIKTATSTKTFLRVHLVKQNLVMEVTEYGAYITDVTVKGVDNKVVYKSKKFSIQDALNNLMVTGDDHINIKALISAIKKQLKSQPPVVIPVPTLVPFNLETPAAVTADKAAEPTAEQESTEPNTEEQVAEEGAEQIVEPGAEEIAEQEIEESSQEIAADSESAQ